VDYGPEDDVGRVINSIHTPPVNQQSQVIIFKFTATCSMRKACSFDGGCYFYVEIGCKIISFSGSKGNIFDP
jgi:hypothetical protein